ncbi:hypothetical protein CO172_00635 [Candidatus Uhrbacteria bacterium CG_4_9_14_3_um_filter_36_7]|uniref:Uncharacterized protein n=1 Tax=Candidatus Uhrbacteria bacterium CG_4_9_14_3_um_filter_36_7 TaxID=1975033 RepID=A0A2M7XI64_9BACT|nr:MAG: hypothetical protein CO172_00635 [Candidatus Uhrbacteria bacterium CG_4_9_14_3_um_filter_36_7]
MDSSAINGSAISSTRRRKTPLSRSTFYGKIMRGSLYLLFFLIPIFFLPWTMDAFEVNKQTILIVLSLVSFMAWLGSMVMEKRLTVRYGWLNIIPLLLIVGVLFSSIFSLAGYQSWVGQASQEYTSFLTTLMFVVLFYVIMNACAQADVQRGIFSALLISAAISGVATLLAVFGALSPFIGKGFNPVGTINTFATFLSFVMLLGVGLWLVSRRQKPELLHEGRRALLQKILIGVVVVVNLLVLISVDFWILWVMNIFGLVLLIVFAFIQQTEFPDTRRFLLPLILLLVSVLFLFIRSPFRLGFPIIVSPSHEVSRSIVWQVLKEGPKSFLLGSGPGTFSYDYAKYRPSSINGTRFWNVRFDRAKTHILTTTATLGIIGILLWMVFVVAVAIKALGRLLREREHEEWKLTYVVFCAWAALSLSLILYSSNLTLQFLFWGFAGLLASHTMSKIKETDFSKSPKLGLLSSFGFVVVTLGVLVVLFITGQRYRSEIAFAHAVRLDRAGASASEVIEPLRVATQANSLSDVYYRNLSQALLLRVRSVLLETKPEEGKDRTPEQIKQIQGLTTASIQSVEQAIAIAPANVLNWMVRGSLFQEFMSLVNNADAVAIASFEQASKLEPNNPLHKANQARVYLLVADRARTLKQNKDQEIVKKAVELEKQALAKAEEALNQAIVLKTDYAVAHYYLAAVYERQGRLDEATTRMKALRNYAPLDVGIGFQLGILYVRQQNYTLAKTEFERIIGLQPKYSDARWYLASIYEIEGNMSGAIEQVQSVVDLNPENQMVAERLMALKKGQSTTTLPKPVEEGEESATSLDHEDVTEETEDSEE